MLVALAGCAASPDESVAAGQSAQALSIAPNPGTLPLLVVMVDHAERPFGHLDSYYRRLLFGPGYPNVADYFSAISRGATSVREAGLIHVWAPDMEDPAFVRRAQIPATEEDAAQRGRYATLQVAEDAGFNFGAWDANHDGVVSSAELAVLQIDNVSDIGGQTNGVPCTKHSGVSVCGAVSLSGHRGELILYAHELLHQIIGAADIYGASAALNMGLSTMAGTPSVDKHFTYFLDPMHRMATGWETRAVAAGLGSRGSATLVPVADPQSGGSRMVVFGKGSEQLIFEYRSPVPDSYEQDVKAGVYAWLVRWDGREVQPALVDALAPDTGLEEATFVLGPEGCLGDPASRGSRGVVTPLVPGGRHRFRWLDGSDTGLAFTVSGSGNARVLSWEPSNAAARCP